MNLFELSAKLTLDSDEYNSGLDRAKEAASNLGKGIGTVFKAGTAAVAATTTAVGAFGAKAVQSYASYEQLIGGVEKLYGEAADKLEAYADVAYKTAGMSANEYMETATSFSAALIKSLEGDVDKAADLTDTAMKAMSDNVNVFGSDMGSVRNAFQGFAKQNYTMLDNLKLGYGGTKEEMDKLIADANEYRASIGESSDLTIESFADIVQAIQSIQEAQKIAGTTREEAMRTIEGSAVATKAAWQNVITAIGKGEGLEEAMDGLITSIFGDENGGGLLNNIIPRVQKAMDGIANFIVKIAPMISEKIPAIIKAILPAMITGGIELAKALGEGIIGALPEILESIFTALEEAIPALAGPLQTLWSVLTNTFQWLIDHSDIIVGVVSAIVGGFMTYKAVTGIIQAVSTAQAVLNAVMSANPIGLVVTAIGALVAAFVVLWNKSEAFREFWINLWEGIKTALKSAGEFIEGVFGAIVNFASNAWEGIKGAFSSIGGWFKDKFTAAKEKAVAAWSNAKTLFGNVWDKIKGAFNIKEALTWGKDMMDNFVQGIKDKVNHVVDAVKGVANKIKSFLGFSEPEEGPLSNFHTYAPDMMRLFAQGIKENTHLVTDQIAKSFDFGEQVVPVKTNVSGADSMSGNAFGGGNQYIININEKIDTPDEIARAIRVEAQYGLIGGVALG